MKLMVIDGNSIVNRAFYGVRLLSTKDGLYTNAIFGFLNILQKLVGEENPDALCVTFDLKAPTFRHKKYEDYKAQRKGMPDELAMQMPVLKDVLDAMNIPRYELEGYEADDLIGTISRKCERAGCECIIVTGDKDSFQLITEKSVVKHVKSRMGQTETITYDKSRFEDEYGFEPIRMIDLKALMGDASDNIPGVAGVGEKTAMDLVRRFGTIDKIYSGLDELDIRDSLKNKLRQGEESARMSYELATICCDAPLEFSPEDNKRRDVDNDKLYTLFKKLEFAKLTEKFGLEPPAEEKEEPEVFEGTCTSFLLETEADFIKMQEAFLNQKEPAGIYLNENLSFAAAVYGETAFIADKNKYNGDFKELLQFVFGPKVQKAGHNIKDMMRRLLEAGISCSGFVFDTALAAYLLAPTDNSYELGRLAEQYCNFTMYDGSDQNGQMSLLEDNEAAELAVRLSYAATVIAVMEVLENKIRENGMEKLYYEIELPLCAVLADMEKEGFLIDKNALEEYGDVLSKAAAEIQKTIYELAGEEFNINSPKQLGVILFEKLMLPAPKKTKTGWSTNIDVLEKIRAYHPIIDQIIDYRKLIKLKSTYTDGLIKVIGADGRIHTNFQMTVTATGRLSSTEPNLQNIPIRTELGGEIRKMFVAGEGNILVDADYSQIELRLLAHISNDETMINAFKSGEDIHRVTASQVFDTPLSEVTSLQRSRAKAVNFGIVYGISKFSLSQDIGVSVAEAGRYMDSYLEKYHGVRNYMKSIVEKAKEDGYVTTLYGRRRELPELKSSNFNIRSFGERVALNMPIQGTAADIMKIAMINVYNRLCRENLRAKLLLQVHDELIVECPEKEEEAVRKILCEEMEGAAKLSLPLTADANSGKNWYDAK